VRRLVGFMLGPFLSAMSPLLILPVLAGKLGEDGWAALAIAQSSGTFVSIAVMFGWPVTGPAIVARAPTAEISGLYYESLRARLPLFGVLSLAALAGSLVTAPAEWRWYAAVSAFVFVLPGLGAGWLCVGLGRPLWIVWYETLPRLATAAVAAAIISAGGSVWSYPVLTLIGTLGGLLYFSSRVITPRRSRGVELPLPQLLRQQWVAAATSIVGAVYSAGTVFLAATVTNSAEVADLSSADRIYRLALIAIMVGSNVLIPMVVRSDPDGLRSTVSAFVAMVALGVLGAPVLALGIPVMCSILFGPELQPSAETSAFYGLAFLAVAMSSTLAHHYLVPRGRVGVFLAGSVAAALIGTPAIVALGARHGATGAAAGLALSECVIVLVLALAVARTVYSGRPVLGRQG
jgi:O-antigen/teichoic acid export membrane protein